MAESSRLEPPADPELMRAMTRDLLPRPIATGSDAETYAQEVTSRIYGPKAAFLQAPFHAEAEGDHWRVTGSRSWGGLAEWYTLDRSGPITVVFGLDGVVRNVYFVMGRIAPSVQDRDHKAADNP